MSFILYQKSVFFFGSFFLHCLEHLQIIILKQKHASLWKSIWWNVYFPLYSLSANLKLFYLFSLVEHANFNVYRNVDAVYFSLDLLASTAAFWENGFINCSSFISRYVDVIWWFWFSHIYYPYQQTPFLKWLMVIDDLLVGVLSYSVSQYEEDIVVIRLYKERQKCRTQCLLNQIYLKFKIRRSLYISRTQ